ncbi:MAG TPA: SMP-30/gluconolactonase/LRE family protein [Verrucomicrobiota bacterium]|nr:SMP-30/gluconolactonase/LRE family protein [Verrucomicrobiota bacterium]
MLFVAGFFAPPSPAATFQIVDPVEFNKIINTNAPLVTNATINAWLEGPVWIPSGGGYLVFCDQGNNRLRKLVPPSTLTDYFLPPANTLFNGTILDAQERLIGAQAGGAALRIVMLTNGIVTPLASTCNGLKFYSPNDVAVKSDGTIWFTDPGYNGGIGAPPQPGFQGGYYVYRFDPTNGNATCTAVITNGLIRPNGLCFSPDESRLYVADSDNSRRRIQVYSVSASNTLSGGAVFATITNGVPDGIRCDVDGRVWSSSGEGVYIFAPDDGRLIGKIRFHRTANLCFGGPEYKTLYMTGQPVVTSIPVLVPGVPSMKTIHARVVDNHVKLSWPAPSTGFVLQETLGAAAGAWTNSSLPVLATNGLNTVGVEATNPAKHFRLRLN